MRQNLKSLRAREQKMFEWRQEPCQFRDITDKVSLPKVTGNQTKPLVKNVNIREKIVTLQG